MVYGVGTLNLKTIGRLSAEEIATSRGLQRPFVAKVLTALSTAGLVVGSLFLMLFVGLTLNQRFIDFVGDKYWIAGFFIPIALGISIAAPLGLVCWLRGASFGY